MYATFDITGQDFHYVMITITIITNGKGKVDQ